MEFEDPKSAKAAHEKNGYNLQGRDIKIDFAASRGSQGGGRSINIEPPKSDPSNTLFVGALSYDATESMIRETFQAHGNLVSVRLPTDRDTGKFKG